MQADQTETAQKQARPKGSLGGFLLDGALLALLGLSILRLAVPTFQGWYHEDDLHNLRWALEYRHEPWLALTERHALHDHVRPLTLMSLWLGTYLGDGAFWGQHLVLVVLNVAAALGVVALGRALGGNLRAGLLAGLLAVSGWGWARLMDWNALMNTAGETAFGVWSLLAVLRGLKRPIWLVPAGLAVVASALFKEPGSFIYPITAVAMAWGAYRAGLRERGVWLTLALPLVGLLVFAFTWHAANVSRMSADTTPVLERMVGFWQSHARMVLNIWPDRGTVADRLGAGVPVLALALVLLRDLIGAPLGERPALRVVWVAGAGLYWGLCLSSPEWPALTLLPLVLLVLARRWADPPPGLVMYLVSVGVMSPFTQSSEVQIIAAAHGLALYTGVGLDAALREERVGRLGRLAAAAAAALSVGLLAGRMTHAPNQSTYRAQQEQKNKILSYGALARTLGVNGAQVAGMGMTEQEVMPLVGIELRQPDRRESPTVAITGGLLISPPPGVIEQVLFPADLIQGVEIPIILEGSGGASLQQSPQGASFDVAAGYYVLGVGTAMGNTMRLTLMARDACGHTWTASQDRTLPVPFTLTPLVLEPGCGPLKLSWVGDAEEPDGIAMLAPLLPPIESMWHPIEIPRTVRVGDHGRPNL